MKLNVSLDSKEVRKIIARYLEIDESQVIPQRYSFNVEGLTIEQIKEKLED